MKALQSAPAATKLTIFYCLPAILAIGLVLWSYYERTEKVSCFIEEQHAFVDNIAKELSSKSARGKSHAQQKQFLENLRAHRNIVDILENKKSSEQLKQLIEYYIQRQLRENDTSIESESKLTLCNGSEIKIHKEISNVTENIWLSNASKVAILALLPFLLLGTHLGFSDKQRASYEVRASVVNKGWWMKFLIGLIMAYGWIYVMNPSGRGAGTLEQFLIRVDLYQTDSLPVLLKGGVIHPIIAGFLGWYLYMLTYFFSKVFTHDVLSTNAFGLMFQKFLLTYGVAVILPSVQANGGVTAGLDTTIVAAFLIGFFPMSAFSMLKDTSMKILHGSGEAEKGQLQELPGISRWQILRLEEEGIDSMGALAAHDRPDELRQNIPAMSNLIDYWVDIARLYTILGQESYQKVKKHCRTASEFVLKANDEKFVAALIADNVVNPDETARILSRTFPHALDYTKD